MTSPDLTPKEIEEAITKGMTSADVRDDGKAMTLILRPPNSSRSFVLVATITQVAEI